MKVETPPPASSSTTLDIPEPGFSVRPRLKVAITGGGPGGLGAAIELSKLPFVSWELYEKKPAISETGGGISLQKHTWRLLQMNGAAKNIREDDFFRGEGGVSGEQRNGRTGELLQRKIHPSSTPPSQISCRMVRAKLQSALLKEVDTSHVWLSKKLVDVVQLPDGKLRIRFEDGFEDDVDLLVGADGIRSVVRSFGFPTHSIRYIGQTAYRAVISKATVFSTVPTIPKAPVFWQNIGGRYVFTCPLGDDAFEVTARILRPAEGQEHVSWGRPFDFAGLVGEFAGFCEPVVQVLELAAREKGEEGRAQEFALFSGPRLESVVSHGAMALVGDASHPLSGAFGAGAGFALEDDYTLARCLDFAWNESEAGKETDLVRMALELYDQVRSPHYRDLYGTLDRLGAVSREVAKEGLGVDEEIAERVRRMQEQRSSWMYSYEVDKVVDEFLGHAPRAP